MPRANRVTLESAQVKVDKLHTALAKVTADYNTALAQWKLLHRVHTEVQYNSVVQVGDDLCQVLAVIPAPGGLSLRVLRNYDAPATAFIAIVQDYQVTAIIGEGSEQDE